MELLNRVASSTVIPALPTDVGFRRSTRSGGHRVAAAIAAGTVLAVGVPVAAAAGGLDSCGSCGLRTRAAAVSASSMPTLLRRRRPLPPRAPW